MALRRIISNEYIANMQKKIFTYRNMYYHIQINYFNSDSGEMTLLSEYNIQDLDDLKERVINPYVFGHSFTFCDINLVLASMHQFRVYESEEAISDSLQSASFDIVDSVMKDVTKEIME